MLKTIRLKTIQGKDISDPHYKLVSLVPIEGINLSTNYRVSPISLMKFKKDKINLKEFQAEYNRQLDARGKHLVEGDLRDSVLVCECENNVHKGTCAVKLLKSYIGIKEDIMTYKDIEKVDYAKEWAEASDDISKCPKCDTVLQPDDDCGMYCSKCDDVVSFEDIED